ncbi:hypothetical protein O181_048447 [Austropuccinia psidii MF-1]|uniref:DUF6533 domain-containing protein n=1 Tax=Austropuccinia psidii MF-1 TaxID=1389203 RepID=A0A9Q3DV45_9BASI|nr:hypothetical protein [Austropuccinia psidii MF-1]
MPTLLDERTIKLISITQTYFAAMYAVAVWDWIISFPREYRRIWKAPRSLIKVLYYCNRYYTLANLLFVLYGFNSQMTESECVSFYKWEPGLASFTTIFAEAILVVRTYALWGRNKYILVILLSGLTIECVVLFFAVTRFQPVPTRDPLDPNSRGACIAGGGPGGHDWTMAYWVSPIVMDTVMLVLSSIRALQYHRKGVDSSVFQTFLKDGILYYVVVFAVNLINTIFYALPSQALQAINSPMSLLMTSIMCSHIVLSLRGEERKEVEAVSKQWQLNTYLRKKKSENSTSVEKSSGGVVQTIDHDKLFTRDINLEAFTIAPPSILSPHPYTENFNLGTSGMVPNDGVHKKAYGGVKIHIEQGEKYEDVEDDNPKATLTDENV